MKIRSTTLALAAALSLSMAAAPAMAKSAAEWLAITGPVQVGINQAVEKAQALVPGKAIEAELKKGKSPGAPYYEVKMVTPANEEVELIVSAATGDAVIEKNKGKVGQKDARRLADAQITLAQAVDAAIASKPGKPLSAELSSDWGKTNYKVLLLQADRVLMKVKLDAVTGQVTSTTKAD